jgi:hypothetical protein
MRMRYNAATCGGGDEVVRIVLNKAFFTRLYVDAGEVLAAVAGLRGLLQVGMVLLIRRRQLSRSYWPWRARFE